MTDAPRKNAATPLYPEKRVVRGMAFLPVVERDGHDHKGFLRLRQAKVNGEGLWSLPGGLMCLDRDLERIADSLLIQRRKSVR